MTAWVDWGLRLVLIGVFAAAATAKLRDREAAREALAGLGGPRRLAFALAPAELAVAALLAVPSTAAAGAVAALGLLALFSVVIAVNSSWTTSTARPCGSPMRWRRTRWCCSGRRTAGSAARGGDSGGGAGGGSRGSSGPGWPGSASSRSPPPCC